MNLKSTGLQQTPMLNLLLPLPISVSHTPVSNGYKADGDIAGIQLIVSGDYNITDNYLPEGWEIANSDNTILLYSLDGSSLDHKALFDYTGDFWIESTIVADWYESSVSTLSILIPREFDLSPAYPNPFNPSTTISFDIPEAADRNTSLHIYDITGKLVETLVNGTVPVGTHTITWNPKNLSSGLYIVQLKVGNKTFNQKLTFLK